MLEVVGEKRERHEVMVIAGLGRSAQWYRNLSAGTATEVAIGRERFAATYRELDSSKAAASWRITSGAIDTSPRPPAR